MNKKLDETPVVPVVVVFSFGSKGTKGNKSLAFAGAIEANNGGAIVIITQKEIPRIDGWQLRQGKFANIANFPKRL